MMPAQYAIVQHISGLLEKKVGAGHEIPLPNARMRMLYPPNHS
jgi:hypothetical protein